MSSTRVLHRISVSEYGVPESLSEQAVKLGITAVQLERYLNQVAQRISTALAVNDPILISKGKFGIVNVAGLIRLAPDIELEVCPKFLAASVASWREDFFAIATIARFGRIFPQEALRSNMAQKGDLADLIGRAIVFLYNRDQRRPLRTYRQAIWQDFNIDGEVEPESLLLPDENGFSQSGIVLDRQNPYNAVIRQAMAQLMTEVRDGDTRRQLYQRQVQLSPQHTLSRLPARRQLPTRHKRWQELYDLSRQVLEGFGIGYADTMQEALPGYIIKTNDAWESLLLTAVRAGMTDRKVEKRGYALGLRSRPGHVDRKVETTPDISICKSDGSCFVVDAKYKGRVTSNGKDTLAIDAADLYEALAFLQATSTTQTVLCYPLPATASNPQHTGATTEFERATVGTCEVIGITVDTRGISKTSGFRQFSDNLAAALKSYGA